MPDLTPRQLAILRILADTDGPQAASFVAACYMLGTGREEMRRDTARQELGVLHSIGLVDTHTSPGGAVVYSITEAGRRAIRRGP